MKKSGHSIHSEPPLASINNCNVLSFDYFQHSNKRQQQNTSLACNMLKQIKVNEPNETNTMRLFVL